MTISENPVLFYESEFYMFSNFSAFAINWRGQFYPTSEHAYQAAKFKNPHLHAKVRQALSAHEALKIAHSLADQVRPNWAETKLSVMEDILRAKLSQHFYIQKKLLQTADRPIVENSPKDAFWGWGPDEQGSNHLGRLWMQLRTELANGHIIRLPEDYS